MGDKCLVLAYSLLLKVVQPGLYIDCQPVVALVTGWSGEGMVQDGALTE